MPRYLWLQQSFLVAVVSLGLTGVACANLGIDSTPGLDLPISAGGTLAMVVQSGTGNVTATNAITANAFAVPGATKPLYVDNLNTLNSLADLPACGSGQLLTKSGSTSLDCIASLGADSLVGGAAFSGGSIQTTDCPDGSVVVGIRVRTTGTCEYKCDGDGPIVAAIQLHCRAVQ